MVEAFYGYWSSDGYDIGSDHDRVLGYGSGHRTHVYNKSQKSWQGLST